jgi:putative PIG3 family NAD(P)H quinone oxidoreductase
MKAVLQRENGGPDVLYIGDAPTPAPSAGELLIRVRAAALNRADLLQRRGQYPPPPGVTNILGLEAAGEIAAVGEGVQGWQLGDPVCVLLPGGGYAQYVTAPAELAMKIPPGMGFEEAAAIPEAYLTAYLNLFRLGELQAGHTVLIHAGASGVGTAAIQLADAAGGRALATAGTPEKLALCRELGAEAVWNYRDGSFRDWALRMTGGSGVQLILDFIGGPYLSDNLRSLAPDGKLVIIGVMGGAKADAVDLGLLLMKRLSIRATTLRSQPLGTKIALTRAFTERFWPMFGSGRLRPVVDSVWDWTQVQEAHAHMEANRNAGKIVLRIS